MSLSTGPGFGFKQGDGADFTEGPTECHVAKNSLQLFKRSVNNSKLDQWHSAPFGSGPVSGHFHPVSTSHNFFFFIFGYMLAPLGHLTACSSVLTGS